MLSAKHRDGASGGRCSSDAQPAMAENTAPPPPPSVQGRRTDKKMTLSKKEMEVDYLVAESCFDDYGSDFQSDKEIMANDGARS
ncbi:hypothetical protein VNO80_25314 [Phaseolus coccineus]|uniref:Uncharacterized protein n=1 Tax=Phaseolus coccineus TaxID=3886 RepID=A0AAN9QLU3_PHACN